MTAKRPRFPLLKLCLSIAILLFVSSVLSDFSVKMFYGTDNFLERILAGIIATVLITVMLMIFLTANPELKKALSRMFGME